MELDKNEKIREEFGSYERLFEEIKRRREIITDKFREELGKRVAENKPHGWYVCEYTDKCSRKLNEKTFCKTCTYDSENKHCIFDYLDKAKPWGFSNLEH